MIKKKNIHQKPFDINNPLKGFLGGCFYITFLTFDRRFPGYERDFFSLTGGYN